MSAPMRLTAAQLHNLSVALEGISKVTRDTRVRFDAYQALDVRVGDATIRVRWDGEQRYGEYVVDDQVGS